MDVLRVIPIAAGERTPLKLGDDASVDAAASGGGSIVRTIVGLVIVVAVIYALQWMLKQAKASKDGSKGSGPGLATIASLAVGGGRTVQLVRAGREYVLVGVGEHGVTALRRYTEDEAAELGLLPVEPEPEGPKAAWLDQLRAKTVLR
jgi:flagellar protein FliO/FliZ